MDANEVTCKCDADFYIVIDIYYRREQQKAGKKNRAQRDLGVPEHELE